MSSILGAKLGANASASAAARQAGRKACALHSSAAARRVACHASVVESPDATSAGATAVVERAEPAALNQTIREGHYEAALVNLQASKADASQASIASALQPADPATTADVTIVGAGPAGLFLAAELAKRGLSVNVLGLDAPIVNNYGVWTDEFRALGMDHTLECSWPDALCYFGEGNEVRVGRGYGRVSRRKLREHLLSICSAAGVRFSAAEVADIAVVEGGSLTALTTKDGRIHEEEWSYIPVGGPLPLASQSVTAFGAAANLVHPATGFSVSRSFREAPGVADEIAAVLRDGLGVAEASKRVWERLWPLEKRTQASFHVFGMELLATLDLAATNDFFNTFFRLPSNYWRGFLASTLSAGQLIAFALVTFVLAPPSIKYKLIEHLVTDPAGGYLIRAYQAQWDASQQAPSSAAAAAAVLLSSQMLTQAALNGLAGRV
ncbi:hypothetical protein GPECTOR_30g278 [Gonium pectorale]|uniref:FAD-binding domain-containing protein n=1 Tax=Gonium pectorale TaxID=33097 RepID=A0A150GEC0_GONPE|nr:hypothetical protein GPECTOR_30g278 [Gonium pectorale]|eukprot:KXZ48182.1 hypothetical protein GPECTOR_30g278 [Gonium pectorale]